MKILFIGDIVGAPGREIVSQHVPEMKASGEVDFVVVNAENIAGGCGITQKTAEHLFEKGCDVITLGDHVWDKRDSYACIDKENRIIRPLNIPDGAPGRGSFVFDGPSGVRVGVMVLLGRTFMKFQADCPFRKLDAVLKEMSSAADIILVDMHAETTSEKVAMGWYADGRVSAVLGTHTHIQTADEKVLPQGTAYITDMGMSGPYDSVIGMKKELILSRYLTSMPNKFEVASEGAMMCGVVVDIDEKTGRARSIVRVQKS